MKSIKSKCTTDSGFTNQFNRKIPTQKYISNKKRQLINKKQSEKSKTKHIKTEKPLLHNKNSNNLKKTFRLPRNTQSLSRTRLIPTKFAKKPSNPGLILMDRCSLVILEKSYE
jgi:hypothetical protein